MKAVMILLQYNRVLVIGGFYLAKLLPVNDFLQWICVQLTSKRKPPTPWKFHEFFTLWLLLSFLSIIDSTLNWIMEDIKKHPCFRILLVSLFANIKHVRGWKLMTSSENCIRAKINRKMQRKSTYRVSKQVLNVQ